MTSDAREKREHDLLLGSGSSSLVSSLANNSLNFDKILMVSVGILVLAGLLMVYSSSSAISREQFDDSLYYLKKQLLWCLIGILAMLFSMFFNYQYYQKLSLLLLMISGIALILVYIPGIGVRSGGSTRWIKISKIGFQPVEIAKLALIIYMARFLSQRSDHLKSFNKGILPGLIIILIFIILLYGQPDFGSIILIGLIMFIMLLVSGTRIKHIIPLIIVAGIFVCYEVWQEPYRMRRLITFLDPWKDPDGRGYHIIQSFYAFGLGGIFGVGIGSGIQKLYYLPTPHTDFIFSVIGEEMGLVGSVAIVLLYMVIVWRGISISLSVKDKFARLLALGISCLIGIQSAINIATVTGSLPTKGITLPFISYGGSSLVTSLIAVGILLNVSRYRMLPDR